MNTLPEIEIHAHSPWKAAEIPWGGVTPASTSDVVAASNRIRSSAAAPSTWHGARPSALLALVVTIGKWLPRGGSRCAARTASASDWRGSCRPRGQKASCTLSVPTATGTPAARSSRIPCHTAPVGRSGCPSLEKEIRGRKSRNGNSGEHELLGKDLQRFRIEVHQLAGVPAQDRPVEAGLGRQVGDDLQSVEPVVKPFVNVKVQRKAIPLGRLERLPDSLPPVCLIEDEDSECAATGRNLPGNRIRDSQDPRSVRRRSMAPTARSRDHCIPGPFRGEPTRLETAHLDCRPGPNPRGF